MSDGRWPSRLYSGSTQPGSGGEQQLRLGSACGNKDKTAAPSGDSGQGNFFMTSTGARCAIAKHGSCQSGYGSHGNYCFFSK